MHQANKQTQTTSCVSAQLLHPHFPLVRASPGAFDSHAGSGTVLDVLSRVLRGNEVETLTLLGKWK